MVNASKNRTLRNKMVAGKSTAVAVVFSFVLILLFACVPAFAQGLAEDDGLNKPQNGDCDQEGPYFSGWDPYFGEPDIPVNLEKFSFNIYDDRSEVDLQTLKIFFPDFTVSYSSSGLVTRHKAGFYEVEYNLPTEYQFHWGDSVHVRTEVYDTYTTAPNLGAGETFFFTLSDENNPEIIPISPIDGDVAVDPDTEIRLTLTDDLSGLNFDSLQVWINGVPLDASSWSVTPDPLESQLTIQPQNFLNNQLVLVRVRITDMAENPADITYQFRIITETEPPVIRFIYPEENGTAVVFPNDSLVFEVDDLLSGISLAESAVELLINSEKIKIDTLMQQDVGATGYRFTIKPRGGFQCNETVALQVLAVDNSGNQFSDENIFSVIADSSGPAIDLIEPGQAASDVPKEHGILVQITDNMAG
ncbi:hypothetical protein KAH55_09710, partial [bacterium]|nr:hypothetical protein [bacterium]